MARFKPGIDEEMHQPPFEDLPSLDIILKEASRAGLYFTDFTQEEKFGKWTPDISGSLNGKPSFFTEDGDIRIKLRSTITHRVALYSISQKAFIAAQSKDKKTCCMATQAKEHMAAKAKEQELKDKVKKPK